jgi:hypothetical protein
MDKCIGCAGSSGKVKIPLIAIRVGVSSDALGKSAYVKFIRADGGRSRANARCRTRCFSNPTRASFYRAIRAQCALQ